MATSAAPMGTIRLSLIWPQLPPSWGGRGVGLALFLTRGMKAASLAQF